LGMQRSDFNYKEKRWRKLIRHLSLFFIFLRLVCRCNSTNRANICARTAVCANIRVDFINIARRDSLYRTLIDTSTASGAIFRNFVSHY